MISIATNRSSLISLRHSFSRGTSSFTAKALEGKTLLSKAPVQNDRLITVARVAKAVKVVRLPFLLIGISTISYQRGVTDALRNPLKLQQGTFEAMLKEFGVENEDEVEVSTNNGYLHNRLDSPIRADKVTDPRLQRVTKVGNEVLKSTQRYVRENLEEAIVKAKQRIVHNEKYVSEKVLTKKLKEDSCVEHWMSALEHIEGHSFEGVDNWAFVLISSPIPNAFVSEMLPQKIFVTTGLFDQFVKNDHELAIILGHEVSHLIKGHLSEASIFESILRGCEILILMLDPTEGLLSIFFASFLSSAREAAIMSKSRLHETEADELGCMLAAMSCYDTRKGVEVFRKMQEAAVENGIVSKTNVISSHPPSKERYENLLALVETQNFKVGTPKSALFLIIFVCLI